VCSYSDYFLFGFPYRLTPAFSTPAFSNPAIYSCIFHSCIFSRPVHESNRYNYNAHYGRNSVCCMAVRCLQHIHYKHLVPPNLYKLGGTKFFFARCAREFKICTPHYEICVGAPVQPYLKHGYLGPMDSITQMASGLVQPFLQGLRFCPTDQHTDHTTQPFYNSLDHTTCMQYTL